jgi:putative aminopeptidase FrvX
MKKILPPMDTRYMLDVLIALLKIPSPTGFTESAIMYTEQALSAFPFLEMRRTHKGALVATWPGKRNDAPRGMTAHIDTLGAMVKEIKGSGRLKLSKIGSFPWNFVEGEGVMVFAQGGKEVHGSILVTQSSVHVYGKKAAETKREDGAIEVRLDALTTSADETRALGIEVGDFVAFDPRVEITNGFVRSRHLDDKAGVASILTALHTMYKSQHKPRHS